MIKLAISDLDGTLLTPQRQLPENTFEIIGKLKAKGILFGAASGRQLQNLLDIFSPVANDMIFISENGGLAYYKGEILFCEALTAEQTAKALATVRAAEGLYPLLCAPECAYYGDTFPPFVEHVNDSYTHTKFADLDDIARSQPVCKIAVYDTLGAEKNGAAILPEKLTELRVIQSGMDWLDLSTKSANKGSALAFILKKFGVSPDECMAFGDHMNDYEMLCTCSHPFVPENAYYKLKELFPHEIPSNKDFGVIRKLETLL